MLYECDIFKTGWTLTFSNLTASKQSLRLSVPRCSLRRLGIFLLHVDGCSISPLPEVCNLGAILDSDPSDQSHIKSVTKSVCYFPLWKPLYTSWWHPYPHLHFFSPGLLQCTPVRTPLSRPCIDCSTLKLCCRRAYPEQMSQASLLVYYLIPHLL